MSYTENGIGQAVTGPVKLTFPQPSWRGMKLNIAFWKGVCVCAELHTCKWFTN